MERQLLTARLETKRLLSEGAQCFHLEFSIDGIEDFPFTAGQFISTVADDKSGKQQTRAYSLASAPRGNCFDLCLNRVENGFFSNLLCDLEPGQTVPFHGPHGMFTLRSPLTTSILIATDTGIAPMRGFVQQLFASGDSTDGKQIWLVYGAEHGANLYYHDEFKRLASHRGNFHYLPTLPQPDEGWQGESGTVQETLSKLIAEESLTTEQPPTDSITTHVYICGLNEMVSTTRTLLKDLGWQRKQIIFERYD